MKMVKHLKDIYCNESGSDIVYVTDTGICVRAVIIDAELGEEVTIGHLSDIHFNACNQQDLEEAAPVIMSTLKHRHWLANGGSVPIARRCLDFLCDVDQLVINGDTPDYLSHGCME